jgi:transposase-like protein
MSFTNVSDVKEAVSSEFAHGMAPAKIAFDNSSLTVMPNKNHRTRRYRDNFKQAAAEFVERNGWSVEQSATELGIDAAELRDWTTKLGSRQKAAKSLNGMAQLRAENEALRNQVLQLQVQWDILKTTLGVLSTTVCTREAA